jgi:hypothetical protein
MQNNESFGDTIQNLQVDSTPNASQQSSLQTLHNILETIKPTATGQEQFALPATQTQKPRVTAKKPQVAPSVAPVQNKFGLIKKTAIITALFIILNTEVFRRLISRFSENSMVQTAIVSVMFAALTLLVIKFYN